MKVLHVVPTYLPATRYGGPIYSVHGLCKSLAALGVEVHVFTTNVDGADDSDVPLNKPVDLDGVKVWYFASKWLRRLYFSSAMAKALREQLPDFDLVHIHSVFLWPTLAAVRASNRLSVPYVIAPRGMLVQSLIDQKNSLLKRLWIFLFDRKHIQEAAAIHVTSQVEQTELDQVIEHDRRYWLVANGTEVPDKNCWQGGDDILFIGRLNWKKGLMELLEAVAADPNWRCVIAGNDEEEYQRELESAVERLGLGERVSFPGTVFGEDKNRLLQQAGVFVLPSLNENFGIAALEAMAHGCPTIVTEGCGLASEVPPGSLVITKPGHRELSESIKLVLANKEQQSELSEAAYRGASRFGWRRIAEDMLNHYRTLCDG